MNCRDCHARLLGIEEPKGICGRCGAANGPPEVVIQRKVVLRGPFKGEMVVSQVMSPVVEPPVVSQESNVTGNVTKQQRWAKAHADQRREIHRDGQRRRRDT